MSESQSVVPIPDELAGLLQPYKHETARRKRLVDFVEQVLHTSARDDFLHLDELLRSKTADEVEAEPGLEAAKPAFDRLRSDAAARVERYRLEFIEDLTARAAQAGLPLEVDFPRLRSLEGIDGQVDFAARQTTLNKKKLKSVDPQRIVQALLRLKRDLYDRPLDPTAFLDALHAAYTTVRERQGRPAGQSVPVQQVYVEYVLGLQSKAFLADMDKGKFRGYSLDQFAVDLWRTFQASTGGTTRGAQLRLDPGRGGLWLIDRSGERRQISGLSFQGGKR